MLREKLFDCTVLALSPIERIKLAFGRGDFGPL